MLNSNGKRFLGFFLERRGQGNKEGERVKSCFDNKEENTLPTALVKFLSPFHSCEKRFIDNDSSIYR